jgi:excisionase family DNA binding protein
MATDAQLLKRFGMLTEEDVAKLLGITVKTLKNRPRADIPEFVKAGRRRLFKEEAVRDYLEAHTVRPAA